MTERSSKNNTCEVEQLTLDHSSISTSPAVVSMMTLPFVGRAMADRTLRSHHEHCAEDGGRDGAVHCKTESYWHCREAPGSGFANTCRRPERQVIRA